MKTITVRLQNDKDAELLMDMLRAVKFQSEVETFEEEDTISDEELQMLNERVEEYRKDPSKGKSIQEVKALLRTNMVYRVTVHDAALVELEDAVDWYSKISVELSEDFAKKFKEALNSVETNPLLNAALREEYRKLNLDRFPYKLTYKIFSDEVLIVAVAHHKRH